MREPAILSLSLALVFAILPACNKSSGRSNKLASGQASAIDGVQRKLQDIAGSGATDCGRVSSQSQEQVKGASDCAMESARSKKPFYVRYDLPGMTTAVAGNSEGKLFSVMQTQQAENTGTTTQDVTATPCSVELRVAQSGRVTCFPPGSFGMGTNNAHGGMGMPPASGANPHGSMGMPPAGTPNPHGGAVPAHDSPQTQQSPK